MKSTGACPPHHWYVTNRVTEDGRYDHYECKRCGAQKDVPVYLSTPTGSVWPRAGKYRPGKKVTK